MKNYRPGPGELEVLQMDVPYVADPTKLFFALCGDRPNTLLLESAEITSRENLKSLMLVDAAARIICRGRTVRISALTPNGTQLLTGLIEPVSELRCDVVRDGDVLTLVFPDAEGVMEEDERLLAPSPFDALRLVQNAFRLDGQPREALFLAGLFAYDLVACFEPLPEVTDGDRCPDYVFYVAETLLIVDHEHRRSRLQGTLFGGIDAAGNYYDLSRRLQSLRDLAIAPSGFPPAVPGAYGKPVASVSDADFCLAVEKLKQRIIAGDIFQVVPSRRFLIDCPSPLRAYRELKIENPSPYMFYMNDSDFTLFGASPESALKYEKTSNQVEIYPIAGTRRRGRKPDGLVDPDLDGRIELELRNDVKENAEHIMLVDLARNDVARISRPGTRFVADLLKVDRYSHVMHLVSRVVGQLRDDLDALHAYQACMNMGTLTGAPKIRAMQLIREFEFRRRGHYGGAVGYLTGEGDMDTCIVIRSAYVEDGIANVQAGAGVVFDSDPEAEADETRGKAQAVITAIERVNRAEVNE